MQREEAAVSSLDSGAAAADRGDFYGDIERSDRRQHFGIAALLSPSLSSTPIKSLSFPHTQKHTLAVQ